MEHITKTAPEVKCKGCGALLHFLPGTSSLQCEYCGTRNEIAPDTATIEETDYNRFLQDQYEKEERMEVVMVRCSECGARITLKPNITADRCPYCASPIMVEGGSTSRVLKPKALVPFQVGGSQARESFSNWLKNLWFAPSDLKQKAHHQKIEGIYIPFWTYDASTLSAYSGQRGDHYYTSEIRTVMERGRSVTRPSRTRHTRWSPVAGDVQADFDDILVPGTRTLNEAQVRKLEPWHLGSLVPFNEKFLSGFRSQAYQVALTEGMKIARRIMESRIRDSVRNDIGGDEQRIDSLEVSYNQVSFKHILLPVWASSYRYGNKVYRFLINGQTGEVQGKRPFSWFKIIGSLLGIALVVIILAAIF